MDIKIYQEDMRTKIDIKEEIAKIASSNDISTKEILEDIVSKMNTEHWKSKLGTSILEININNQSISMVLQTIIEPRLAAKVAEVFLAWIKDKC